MASLRPVLYVNGLFLTALSLLMLLPLVYNLFTHDPQIWGFIKATVVTMGVGGATGCLLPF